ncbi:unknown [Bacteroides sp. CAG:709]|nr:unknown [Bacteroides sp. CAG:709]
MIFVSFKSLTIDQKKSACDFIAAIRYIEEANNNIQINPTNLTSDKDLFIMELWDSKIEGLLRKRIPIFFNKEKNVWGKNTRLNMLEHLLEVSV